MTGLIWVIQLVHYPGFGYVDKSNFTSFTHFHNSRITLIVLPVMVAELCSAVFLCWQVRWGGVDASDAVNFYLDLNLIGVACIWAVTFFASVPAHERLGKAKDPKALKCLVATNWLRTGLWSLRSISWFVCVWLGVQALL